MKDNFSTEFSADEDDDEQESSSLKIPAGAKNYITPAGYKRLQDELDHLWKTERPALVQTITWAAGNGDRSENGDYIYGKKRLREIDKRIRFLAKRLEKSEVVDPAQRCDCTQVFFGATVTVCNSKGEERTFSIVGVDEAEPARGLISWVSPLARAVIKAKVEDTVSLRLPNGIDELEIVEVEYRSISLE